MGQDVKSLFHEVAGFSVRDREAHYARWNVPPAVREEIESLLAYDETAGDSLTAVVGAAAEHYLMSNAPVIEGSRCGPYRLDRLLGNGGMGAVYLAERIDGEIEQRVAIKFVRTGPNLPAFRDRFLRERQILASLHHPGIARLLDVGHSAGQPYLAMEYVEGTTIDRYAAGLDTRSILQLFVRVAEAVSYAHRNLVLHRDIKPSNILVDKAGHPKLLDFGIAKIVDAADETQTMAMAMTPEYASPEQLRGDAHATTSDIYSLGALLYRLLTGRSIRQPADPAAHPLPQDLSAILTKAMREEPEERYASVDLMIADIEAFLQHRPVQARRGNAFYLARKFLRRYWLPTAAIGLALAGISTGFVIANHERALAERRFDQVRQLSQEFLDLDAEIRELPGATKARQRIVTASLRYLDRLAAETRPNAWGVRKRQDTELALEIGNAYLQAARMQGIPTNPNLGQFDQARVSLAKAGTFVESVLAEPSFPKHREALLLSAEIAHGAMILNESERRDAEAAANLKQAADRLEQFLETPKVSDADSLSAARLYVNLALNSSNTHRVSEAAVYARRAVDLARRAPNHDRELTRALGVLSNAARFSGDLPGALTAIRESRDLAERNMDPDNMMSLLHYAAAIWREGLILGEANNINLGRPDEAIPLLQKSLDQAEALARKDPHDYTSRSYVSMAGRELGDILRDTQPARALDVYEHAMRRVGEVRNNPKARRDQVWLLLGSSYPLRDLGRTAEAARRIDAAFAILRELKDYPSEQIRLGGEVDHTIRALADHYAATGRTSDAIAVFEDLHQKVKASDPHPRTDLRHANNLSRIYRSLAALHAKSGDAVEAKALRRRNLDIWLHWNAKLPGNSFVLRQLTAAQGK